MAAVSKSESFDGYNLISFDDGTFGYWTPGGAQKDGYKSKDGAKKAAKKIAAKEKTQANAAVHREQPISDTGTQLEADIKDAYRKAADELIKKWKRFVASDAAKTTVGVQQAKAVRDLADQCSDIVTDAASVATKIINNAAPSVYTRAYNEGGFQIEKGLNARTAFSLINENAVNALIKDTPDLLPTATVNVAKTKAWNKKHLVSAITQSVIQGESVPQAAKRLQSVCGMQAAQSIRNARTMLTSAENKGHLDAYKQAQALGIDVQQQWLAALDSRTRTSHRHLDGEICAIGNKFSNGLRYPGDPAGRPEEVYNCRCTTVAIVDNEAYDGDTFEVTEHNEPVVAPKSLTDDQKNRITDFTAGGFGTFKQAVDDETYAYACNHQWDAKYNLFRVENNAFTYKQLFNVDGTLTDAAKNGFSFNSGMRSFSHGPTAFSNILTDMQNWDDDIAANNVVFRVKGGKGFNVSSYSSFGYQDEWLVGGKFKVVGTKFEKLKGYDEPIRVVDLKQIEVEPAPVKTTTSKRAVTVDLSTRANKLKKTSYTEWKAGKNDPKPAKTTIKTTVSGKKVQITWPKLASADLEISEKPSDMSWVNDAAYKAYTVDTASVTSYKDFESYLAKRGISLDTGSETLKTKYYDKPMPKAVAKQADQIIAALCQYDQLGGLNGLKSINMWDSAVGGQAEYYFRALGEAAFDKDKTIHFHDGPTSMFQVMHEFAHVWSDVSKPAGYDAGTWSAHLLDMVGARSGKAYFGATASDSYAAEIFADYVGKAFTSVKDGQNRIGLEKFAAEVASVAPKKIAVKKTVAKKAAAKKAVTKTPVDKKTTKRAVKRPAATAIAAKNPAAAEVYSDATAYIKYKTARDADNALRPTLAQVWKKANKEQRYAALHYTRMPAANGVLYTTSTKSLAERRAAIRASEYHDEIKALTKLISKSSYSQAMTVRRYTDFTELEAFLGCEYTTANKCVGVANRLQGFVSTTCDWFTETDFQFSASTEVEVYIHLPAGAQALYCEPFSEYRGDKSYDKYTGSQVPKSFGKEMELLLQRGGYYVCTDAEELKNGRVRITLELHPEQGYDI